MDVFNVSIAFRGSTTSVPVQVRWSLSNL